MTAVSEQYRALHARLITTGNLLAAQARGQIAPSPGLADIWDSTLEALNDELNKRNKLPKADFADRVHIGACDLCGLFDHHLVVGLCPECQPKTETHERKEAPL